MPAHASPPTSAHPPLISPRPSQARTLTQDDSVLRTASTIAFANDTSEAPTLLAPTLRPCGSQIEAESDVSPRSNGRPPSPTPRPGVLPVSGASDEEEGTAPDRILQQISPAAAFSHFRDLIAAKRKSNLQGRHEWHPPADLENLNSVLTRYDVEKLFEIYFNHIHREYDPT